MPLTPTHTTTGTSAAGPPLAASVATPDKGIGVPFGTVVTVVVTVAL